MLNQIDLIDGSLRSYTNKIVRKASDMQGSFYDEEALKRLISSGDPVIYEVYEWKLSDSSGNLSYAVTKINPGDVNGEFYMTKGHYHEKEWMGELYLGIRGKGVLLMQNRVGDFRIVEIKRGVIAYVPPGYAHRSVNVGDDELVFLAIYPSDAGHNYGEIKDKGFRKRVVKGKCGEYEVVENEKYREGDKFA